MDEIIKILTLSELDEGVVMDMIIESANDLCDDEYRQVAMQEDFDSFWQMHSKCLRNDIQYVIISRRRNVRRLIVWQQEQRMSLQG